MSRQLSGQLSPLSHLNPVLPFRRPIAYTGNVFTPNQLFKFDKKRKKITCFMLVSNKDCNYYYYYHFSFSYLCLLGL